jgi:hypothetical protein
MPFLNLDNEWPLFNQIEVLGVMFFPQNEDKREQFRTIMRAKIYIELVDNNKKILLDEKSKDALINDLLNIDNKLINTPSFDGLWHTIGYASIGGHLAGDILIYLHQMIDAGNIKEPSINKAKSIVVTKYDKSKLFNGTVISLKKDKNTLWTKYKPVAHLWAAWHEFTGDSKPDLQAALSGFSHNPLSDDFPRFLAVAEYFRKFGEGTKTPRSHEGRNEFVLDANETWQVPNNYPLPAISPPYYSGLDAWAINILKDKFPRSIT